MSEEIIREDIAEEEEIITLEFDDNTAVDCVLMGTFEADNGKEYVALEPLDGTDDVYIYGYKDVDNDQFEIIDILDDEEYEIAVAAFDAIMADLVEE